MLYVFNEARLTAAPLRFGKHWDGLFDRWRFPWRRLLLEAKGKPAQAFGVALHQNGNVVTLLFARAGDQPSDILGSGDRFLPDLDDDIAGAQSGLCRSPVGDDLRHDDAVTPRVIAPRQAPAGTDRGGCRSARPRRGPRNLLDGRRDDQRFVVAPDAQADDSTWSRVCDRAGQRRTFHQHVAVTQDDVAGHDSAFAGTAALVVPPTMLPRLSTGSTRPRFPV